MGRVRVLALQSQPLGATGCRESGGMNVFPSLQELPEPYLFPPWTVLPWADTELSGWRPTVSCAWSSETRQGAGRWVDEEGRFPEGSLTTPVSLVAKGDRQGYRGGGSDGF